MSVLSMSLSLKKENNTLYKKFFLSLSTMFLVGYVFFASTCSTAIAQSFDTSIEIRLSPERPRALQEVTATLESFSTNLETSSISWTINSKLIEQGIGKTQITFKTGALGNLSRIRALITSTDGTRYEQAVDVHPAEVDIVWEALTYTPPLYKGKALSSRESAIRISAIPHIILENGKKIKDSDLVFTWEQDRKILGSLSGTGKKAIKIRFPQLSEETHIAVRVESLSGTYKAKQEILIKNQNPEVILYEKHPTEGIRFEKALSEATLVQEEITVRAEPYFFSIEDLGNRNMSFKWLLNNQPAYPSNLDNELTLRKEGVSGKAQLSFEIENLVKIFQLAKATAFINF